MLDINQECYGQYMGISGLAFPYLPIEKMQNYKKNHRNITMMTAIICRKGTK